MEQLTKKRRLAHELRENGAVELMGDLGILAARLTRPLVASGIHRGKRTKGTEGDYVITVNSIQLVLRVLRHS